MLELQHISFGVEQDGEHKEILHDVNLTISERFVAITGPNGGGKSTLAKIIAGIIQPTSGQIILDGEDITEMNITGGNFASTFAGTLIRIRFITRS